MIGERDSLDLLHRVLTFSEAEQAEAVLAAEDLSVTRWNQNYIHQNLARRRHTVTVRAIDRGAMGLAATDDLSAGALRETCARALAYARLQKPSAEPPILASPADKPQERVPSAFLAATAGFSPEARADGCGIVIGEARAAGLESAGTFATSGFETAVVNSNGIAAYHAGGKAFIRTIVNDGDNTGYADRLVVDTEEIDYLGLAREAISKATLRKVAEALAPGRYDTVFEPVALADLIRFLGMLAFGAKAVQEGRSFMGPTRGRKVMGDEVTIWDDGCDPRTIAAPFDAEGVPKRKVTIIDRGVVNDVVYDTQTAAREGRPSTGHASPHGRWMAGPMPRNMLMAPGKATREELIRSTPNGVLVTRFHYTHAPEPVRVVATGTTRDGTYLIRDGELVARLKNLRFTESMIDAFGRVDGVANQGRLARDWWSTFESYLPALRMREFTFTGATTF